MKILRQSWLIVAAFVLMTACHGDDPDVVNLAANISDGEALTRAAGTDAQLQVKQFLPSLAIRVECYDHTTGAVYDNSTGIYTTTDTQGAAEGTIALSGTIYYPPETHNVDICAYYPATVNSGTALFPATGNITDQTALSAYQGFDLMYADRLSDRQRGQTHQLTFHHALSQVIVNLSPGTGVSADDITANVTAVKVNNIVPVATLSISAGAITASPKDGTAAADINILGTGAGNVGLIVPQTVAAETAFITVTYAGIDYTYALPAEKTFAPGYKYTYNFTMNATSLVLQSQQITPWTTGTGGSASVIL